MASVFLSHSSLDKPFVRDLYRRLQRDGIHCFFDEESIEWGANFVRALERGIDECSHLVLVLSPAFLDSKWAELERTASMANDPAGVQRKILPLTLVPCRDHPRFPRFLRPFQALDISSRALFDQWYPKICAHLGGTLREDTALPDDGAIPPPVAIELPRGSWMPHRSLGERFVGRIDALLRLRKALTNDRAAVVQGIGMVTGTGGLGKTQLAIEYAHRFAGAYPGGVYWIEAEQGLAQLIATIASARSLDLDGTAPVAMQLQAVWRDLARGAATLVILDNFPETGPLRPWLPPTGPIHVLVTTRRRDLSQYVSIGLQMLSLDEGIALLNTGQRRYGSEASALVEAVGALPLALELLRGYLDNRPDVTPAVLCAALSEGNAVAYLEQFSEDYRDELPTGHEKGVLRTFALSWEPTSEPARRLLSAIAYLAPVAVPRRLLQGISGERQDQLTDPLRESLTDLRRRSLVDFDADDNPITHRLIMGFVRYQRELDPLLRRMIRDSVLAEMERTYDRYDTAHLRELEAVVPHAVTLLSHAWFADENEARLAQAVGVHHWNSGRWELARRYLALAHGFVHESQRFSETWDELPVYLAEALEALGRFEEARDHLRAAVFRRSYFSRHTNSAPKLAERILRLASVLQRLGDLGEARDWLYRLLDMYEARRVSSHPVVAIAKLRLAIDARNRGDVDEAQALEQAVLNSRAASFPSGAMHLALAKSEIAAMLTDLGELAAAEDFLRAALASHEASFAAGHPEIAKAKWQLAVNLHGQGESDVACRLLRAALASNEACFPAGHPTVAQTQWSLANVLASLGEPKEARELLQRCCATFQERYGAKHPWTRAARLDLDGLPPDP